MRESVGRPLLFFRAAEAMPRPKVYAGGRLPFRLVKNDISWEPSFGRPVK